MYEDESAAIHRKDSDRGKLLEYCQSLKAELEAQRYEGEPIQVLLDDRDIRGGEKTWQHIKKGVPLRVEVGPRDMEKNAVFLGRRDLTPKDKTSMDRQEFVNRAAELLSKMQNTLLERAKAFREEHSQEINSVDDLKSYFTPKNANKPEIHGGFAYAHCAGNPEVEKHLKAMKLTHRCVPVDGPEDPGVCLFTGEKTQKRSVIAKAY